MRTVGQAKFYEVGDRVTVIVDHKNLTAIEGTVEYVTKPGSSKAGYTVLLDEGFDDHYDGTTIDRIHVGVEDIS